MAPANRCPTCREQIHPFAATCPACGTDLDAWRRQRAAGASRPRLSLPQVPGDTTELVVIGLILLLLALFIPLIGAIVALLVVWNSDRNGMPGRRNAAIACAALAIFNLFFPQVLMPHL